MKYSGIAIFIAVGVCSAQIPPAFESATIQISKSLDATSGYDTSPRGLSIRNKTLKDCIRLAYNVKVAQLSGGPKWVDTDRYNIEAKSKRPAEEPELMRMLQTLLKERFKLEMRRETKMVPGYAIAVLKTGLKIREVEPGPAHANTRRGSLRAEAVSMTKLAETLSDLLGAPVTDSTGVAGVFTFALDWTPEAARPGLSSDDAPPSALPDMPEGPSLFAAIQEQLGLKLEGRRGPLDVLIIDRAEKPVHP
jgi:uncharacterized protein (TIGR03435 family)